MRIWSLLAALLLLAQAGTYRVHVAMNADIGQSVKVHQDATISQAVTLRDAAGKVKKTFTRDGHNLEEWTGLTLRRAGENATYKRTWTRAEQEANGTRKFSPLQGLSVTFLVRGENVGMMASNGAPISEEARQNIEQLERSRLHAERNNLCVPLTPLAAGSTWTIAPEQARDCFSELGVVTGPVTATGKLTAVEGGYATIDFKFAMKLTTLGSLEFVSPAPLDGTMHVRTSLSDPLDWTSTKTFHLVGTVRPPGQSESGTTDLHGTTTMRSGRG